MDFRTTLSAEFDRRRQVNARYSLRAFAMTLGTHHATLSQILRGQRRATPRIIHQLGPALGLTDADIREACLEEHCRAIRQVVADTRFRADSRWIAMLTGIPLDDVNIALHWLLYRRQLVMSAPQTWTLGEA
jgi:transcriptional regulator with XRE-family HTH domain